MKCSLYLLLIGSNLLGCPVMINIIQISFGLFGGIPSEFPQKYKDFSGKSNRFRNSFSSSFSSKYLANNSESMGKFKDFAKSHNTTSGL